jgi:hypothetical protein
MTSLALEVEQFVWLPARGFHDGPQSPMVAEAEDTFAVRPPMIRSGTGAASLRARQGPAAA